MYRLTAIKGMTKFEWFEIEFENLSSKEQIEVFNKYCELSKHYRDEIYPLAEFNERFASWKPLDVVRMACYNNHRINFSDEYFAKTWNGFKTFHTPYWHIKDYLCDVFKCEGAWCSYIKLDDFVDYMYHKLLYLKPNDMCDNDFYTIVSLAALKCNTESEFESAIKAKLAKK